MFPRWGMLVAIIVLACIVILLSAVIALMVKKIGKLKRKINDAAAVEAMPVQAVQKAEDIKASENTWAFTKSLKLLEDVEEPVAPDIVVSDNVHLESEDDCAIDKAVSELSLVDMTYFTALISAFSAYKRTIIRKTALEYVLMQGKEVVARLHILQGIVCLDCFVENAEIIGSGIGKYNIADSSVRFKITNQTALSNALDGLRIAADEAYSARFDETRAAN